MGCSFFISFIRVQPLMNGKQVFTPNIYPSASSMNWSYQSVRDLKRMQVLYERLSNSKADLCTENEVRWRTPLASGESRMCQYLPGGRQKIRVEIIYLDVFCEEMSVVKFLWHILKHGEYSSDWRQSTCQWILETKSICLMTWEYPFL